MVENSPTNRPISFIYSCYSSSPQITLMLTGLHTLILKKGHYNLHCHQKMVYIILTHSLPTSMGQS